MASPLRSAEAVQPSVQQPNLMPCPTPCPPYRPAVRPQHTLPPQSRRAGDPICHPPVARTRPYALVFLHQTRERRPLHHPHSRTHHPVIRIAAQCHAEVTREVSRHENNQRAKPCRSYRGSRAGKQWTLCAPSSFRTRKKSIYNHTQGYQSNQMHPPPRRPYPPTLPPHACRGSDRRRPTLTPLPLDPTMRPKIPPLPSAEAGPLAQCA